MRTVVMVMEIERWTYAPSIEEEPATESKKFLSAFPTCPARSLLPAIAARRFSSSEA